MENKKHKILFILLLGLLSLSLIQHIFPFLPEKKLRGDIQEVAFPKWSFSDFYSGKYSAEIDNYIQHNFGLHSWAIRLDNQIEYSFFNKAKANGVIIGKHNYLYENKYIDAYYGKDFVGSDSVQHQIRKLQAVRDTLRKLDKDVWVIFLPGKASLVPENIPDTHRSTFEAQSNYSVYKQEIEKAGIPFLDLRALFLEWKEKSVYPLFPKLGIHWSEMAEIFAMQQMGKFAQAQLQEPLPQLQIKMTPPVHASFGRDNDIAEAMNLLIPIQSEVLVYPEYSYTSDTSAKNKVLVIGDSFYFGPFSKHFSRIIFGNGAFWYYNRMAYQFEKEELDLNGIDKKSQWENHDKICLIMTEVNYPKFGFGFVEEAYNRYYGTKGASIK